MEHADTISVRQASLQRRGLDAKPILQTVCGIGISAVPSLPKAVRRVRLPYPALIHAPGVAVWFGGTGFQPVRFGSTGESANQTLPTGS